MKIWGSIILMMIGLSNLSAQNYSDSVSVNFFLLDECRISQNITGEINAVYQRYKQGIFSFACYFPRQSSTPKKIASFLDMYKIVIPYFTDYDKLQMQRYGASIAPEVVVYDEINQEVLYRGRINNSYDQLGSRRRVVTSRDLMDALSAISNNAPIKEKETQAIGCYLN